MRSRNENRRYRPKRGDAQSGSLGKKYESDFGVQSNLKPETLKGQRDEGPPLLQVQREGQYKE